MKSASVGGVRPAVLLSYGRHACLSHFPQAVMHVLAMRDCGVLGEARGCRFIGGTIVSIG